MALTASSGNASASVTARRPSWADIKGDGASKSLAYAPHHDSPTDGSYYFWLTQLAGNAPNQILVQTLRVKFWELK